MHKTVGLQGFGLKNDSRLGSNPPQSSHAGESGKDHSSMNVYTGGPTAAYSGTNVA